MSQSRKTLYTFAELKDNIKFTLLLTLISSTLALVLIMTLFTTGRAKSDLVHEYESLDAVFVDFLFLNTALHSELPEDDNVLGVPWREQMGVFADNAIVEHYGLGEGYDSTAEHLSGYVKKLYSFNLKGALFNNEVHQHDDMCVAMTQRLYVQTNEKKAQYQADIQELEERRNVLRSLIQVLVGSCVFILLYLLIYSWYGNDPTKSV
jgi:hypothetical protein